ncbi:hypothetical protein D5274_04180 [bacterium 1XD42-94]|jgi:hypothetical protein|nr:hypothetical protein [bacterium 1XD42-76]NBK04373.1 hypothetical protein [bacterium 1XD42-94]
MGRIMDSFWIFLFCLALGGFLFWKNVPGLMALIKGAQPLTAEDELEEVEGTYVSWNVTYPVDEYMETTKTTKINGVSTGTKKHRSSWLVIDKDRGICLSIEVPVKRFNEMMEQSDTFFDSIQTETDIPDGGVPVSGSLEVLEGEELRYFKQMARSYDLPVGDVVYHIRDGSVYGETKTNIYGLSAIGVFLLLIASFILYKTLDNSAKRLIDQYLAQNPDVTMEQLESDFAAAQEVNKVWVGKRWTFSPKMGPNMQYLLFDNNQLIWVHSGAVRSGKSVNFYVWWSLIDGSERQVSLSSEKKCTQVMEKYNQFAHVVVGNSAEYGYMLQNDREAFLDLKYRNAAGKE